MSATRSKKKKPMARVSQIPLFQREIREHLSLSAFEVLVAGARVLSEGQIAQQDSSGPTYFGSTMVTWDLRRSATHLRGPLDASVAEKLLSLCQQDDQVRERLFEVARKEASRLAGTALSDWDIEMTVMRKGAQVLVDLDVEAKAEVPSLLHRAG